MASSAALPQTLKSITSTKIAEVSKRRRTFYESFKSAKDGANNEKAAWEKVDKLLSGAQRLEGVYILDDAASDTDDTEPDTTTGQDLKNKYRFLRQAKRDPSFSSAVLEQFKNELHEGFERQAIKHEHTLFFSNLVTEWLDELDEPDSKAPEGSANGAGFQEVGRAEMHEQRAEWERLVFDASGQPDPVGMDTYLDKLFKKDKVCKDATEELQKEIKKFCNAQQYAPQKFDVGKLETIAGQLRRSDLLSDEKKAILKEFANNKEVGQEVADVLNLKLSAIDNWNWTESNGIPVEMRRQLNGKYRVFMDEDVIVAILLQYLGNEWALKFQSVFKNFFHSKAWRKTSKGFRKQDRERRAFFLGDTDDVRDAHYGVAAKRRIMYDRDYFMVQLPSYGDPEPREYDSTSNDGTKTGKDPLDIKHSLLHLLATEALIARRLRGGQTVIRSDFRWFGPSLPHTTIFTVLNYFGVTECWLEFFRKFLTPAMRFVQDGPDAQVQRRKKGVPMSHVLSDVFGEAILFCMDFAVHRHTEGSFLYRLHDDFWFWGSRDNCKRAWGAMREFADLMGIAFNEDKTGSVALQALDSHNEDSTSVSEQSIEDSPATTAADGLPVGEIRWGFLRLDATEARFIVDQQRVDEHIKELKRQLSTRKSIFGWVQAYNSYFARFFSNNFGKPAYCFGRVHVDMLIDTLGRIQTALFSDTTVTDYLRARISDKFGVEGLPEGIFYLPTELGGLGLRNPLIPLFAMRENLRRSPEKMLEKALDKDELEYYSAKARFERSAVLYRGLGPHPNPDLQKEVDESEEKFMSLKEYTRYREEKSQNLANVYSKLLAVPEQTEIFEVGDVRAAMAELEISAESSVFGSSWDSMDPYWKWVAALYGNGVVAKFGGLASVDAAQVPLGVVNMLKAGKVRWQG